MALGWTDRDPTAGVKGYKSKEIRTWTEHEIEIFEARWPEGTRERLAFALRLYKGQRGSDVYRMTWADIVQGTIRVAQQKTAAKLTIPIHDALDRMFEIANRDQNTILVTAYAQPFSVKGSGNMVSGAIHEAGLPDRCKPHGLRKAAARRLAEAGCSAGEIAAITGHKTLAEVERYTRAADQVRLARQAIRKQIETGSGKPPSDEVANDGSESLEINNLMANLALPRGIEPLMRTAHCPCDLGREPWSRSRCCLGGWRRPRAFANKAIKPEFEQFCTHKDAAASARLDARVGYHPIAYLKERSPALSARCQANEKSCAMSRQGPWTPGIGSNGRMVPSSSPTIRPVCRLAALLRTTDRPK